MTKQDKNKIKISIAITDDTGYTILNENSFEMAILDLINEKEWYNFDSKNKFMKYFKKGLHRIKKKVKKK